MNFVFLVLLLVALCGIALAIQQIHSRHIAGWLMSYLRQDWHEGVPKGTTRHVLFCFVDHYEPGWKTKDIAVERARVQRWHEDYPRLCDGMRDADGRPPVHTFYYPEEEYRKEHLDKIVDLCRMGIGEIDIHLHHENDTEDGLREKLSRFTELLVRDHDALSRNPATGKPNWSFIHGNWSLCNSHPKGWGCGVDRELPILREEGCYADYTMPSAPDPCQTRTINQIYYASDIPGQSKSHDTGVPVQVGKPASGDMMMIQGPLGFRWNSRKFGILPRIENADVRTSCPPTPDRIDGWVNAGVHVRGKPEWTVIKVHTHGTQERDMDTLLGAPMRRAFEYLQTRYNDGKQWQLHYVSGRELYNIIKAAEAGETGAPGQYRDYLIPRPGFGAAPLAAG
jgi:hypothetical protein